LIIGTHLWNCPHAIGFESGQASWVGSDAIPIRRSSYNQLVPETNNVVAAATTTPKLQDGVIATAAIAPIHEPGCTVFVHYNGPTNQLQGICAGMATLDPGASPHPPHRHPEEEILIVADGTGIIECDGKVTQVGPGAMMYCAGNTLHGITNTGATQMTFYWSKWLAHGVSA